MIISGGFVIETPNKPTFSDMLVWNFINMNAHIYAPDVLTVCWVFDARMELNCCVRVFVNEKTEE